MNNRVTIPNQKGGIYFEYRLLSSRAYWELNGSEKNILNAFMLKRQLIDHNTAKRLKIKNNDAAMVRNNGKIIFTYKEAEKYGISKSTFTRCIDKLVEVGFIDIVEPGGHNTPTLYAISDRWTKHGTPDAEPIYRKKLNNQRIGAKSRFKKYKSPTKVNTS